MKTIKRLAVLTGTMAVAGTLFSPSALAAPASSPTGVTPYNSTGTPGGGGDYGIGNCGYNNGGDTKFAGPKGGTNRGLGGFKKGDSCTVQPVAEPETTDTTTTDTTTTDTTTTDTTTTDTTTTDTETSVELTSGDATFV